MDKHPFVYQKPSADETKLIEHFRCAPADVHDAVVGELPNSRERSLAITKLEEASMWLNKAVVFNGVTYPGDVLGSESKEKK